MQRYSKGDTQAFDELYLRNKAPLYRYFLRQIQVSNHAEELCQEVWTNIIRARQQYRVSAKFTTFLYQIAHNRLIDHIRLRANQIEQHSVEYNSTDELQDHHHQQPEFQVENAEKRQMILQLVSQLPDDQREVFLLKEEAGLDLHDIASITGTKHETAKSRLRYALAKLREGLTSVG